MGRIVDRLSPLCYTLPEPDPQRCAFQEGALTMAEQEEERKGGKGRIIAILAAIGAALAILAFWRRRRGGEESE